VLRDRRRPQLRLRDPHSPARRTADRPDPQPLARAPALRLMPVVALIPARGGSKAIPRKNLAPLAGKPLLAYAAEAALAARSVDRVLLSTDDDEIAAAGRTLGLEIPFLRPPEIAGDDTPMLAVIAHLLDHLKAESAAPEALVLLQPTSPFRTARHIDEAVALFRARRADSVVSVVAMPHQFTPTSLMRM